MVDIKTAWPGLSGGGTQSRRPSSRASPECGYEKRCTSRSDDATRLALRLKLLAE